MARTPIEFLRRADRPTRELVDSTGQPWRVFEVDVRGIAAPDGSLIASHDDIIRRIRDYPDAWYDLTDEELEGLIHRPPVRRDALT